MHRIVVVPEQLRALSARLQQAATELDALGGRIGGAYSGLDWETRYKAGVEGQVGDARRRAAALAQQAEAMARFLAAKAQAFEEADFEGARNLEIAVRPYWKDVVVPVPTPAPTPTPAPSDQPSFASWEDVARFLNDLLKPIDWATNTKREERQFFKTLEELGRWLNVITGQRGYIKRLKGLGAFLRDASKGLGAAATLLDARDWKRYLDGQLTNREIAEIATTTIVSAAVTSLHLPLLPAIGAAILSQPLVDWAISNMSDPNGRWRGPVGPLE